MKMDKSVEVSVQSTELLERLYQDFDDLGMVKQYSEDRAELEVRISDMWVLFYVDRRYLDDERNIAEAYEDANRIAETYWRQ
jgi:hypothetical protein